MTDDLDLERLPHEIRRAVEAGPDPVLVDQLTPGLFVRPDPDHDALVVLTAEGREVGTIPMHRLRDVPADHAERLVDLLIQAFPVGLADQVRTDVEHGGTALVCPVDEDYVYLRTLGGIVSRFHRSWVVPSWPTEELPPGLLDHRPDDGPDAP